MDLNQYRCIGMSTLPNEILCEIFQNLNVKVPPNLYLVNYLFNIVIENNPKHKIHEYLRKHNIEYWVDVKKI